MGFTEVSGYYTQLNAGFHENGIKSVFLSLVKHPFQYGDCVENNNIPFYGLLQYTAKIRYENRKNIYAKFFILILQQVLLIFVFFWAIFNFDVFIFGFKYSFFWNGYDLPFLKMFKKKIIFIFHGSDSRPPYIDGSYFENPLISADYYVKKTKIQKKYVSWIEKYATYIVSHPPSSHFHSRKFIPWLKIGIPYRVNIQEIPMKDWEIGDKIRILHSPSNPMAKGSFEIEKNIKDFSLKNKIFDIEYIEISGKPNKVVLEEIRRSHIVIDQLYSDTPMAGFATEAASYGKIVIVGTYALKHDFGISNDFMPPTILCKPEDLQEKLYDAILSLKKKNHDENKIASFVTKNWDRREVARRYVNIIEFGYPEAEMYDPKDIKYLYGCCFSMDKVKFTVKKIVDEFGIGALCLSDKPELENMFFELYNNGERK